MYTSALSYRVTDVSSIGSLFEILYLLLFVQFLFSPFFLSLCFAIFTSYQSVRVFFFPIVSILFTQQPFFSFYIYVTFYVQLTLHCFLIHSNIYTRVKCQSNSNDCIYLPNDCTIDTVH